MNKPNIIIRYIFKRKVDGKIYPVIVPIGILEDAHGEIFSMLLNKQWVLIERNLYTGRNDKNNKAIFAGDILNFPEQSTIEHKDKINHPYWYGVVGYYTNNDKAEFNAGKLIYKWSACEVIGNIYENAELLK